MSHTFFLKLRPVWDEVERARNEVEALLSLRGLRPDVVSAVAMVTSELVENAVKYGKYDQAEGEPISVSVEISPREIVTEVKNPAGDAAAEDLRLLDDAIQWIRGFQSPFQAYVEKLRSVSERGNGDGSSGLGLVRIAYEGQCITDFYIDHESTLAMSAVYKLA